MITLYECEECGIIYGSFEQAEKCEIKDVKKGDSE